MGKGEENEDEKERSAVWWGECGFERGLKGV